MRPGELISKEDVERWQQRGLIRAIPRRGSVRRIRAEELARLPASEFTGFAPFREDHDVVRLDRARSIG